MSVFVHFSGAVAGVLRARRDAVIVGKDSVSIMCKVKRILDKNNATEEFESEESYEDEEHV